MRKKLLVLSMAAFLFSAATYANNGDKGKEKGKKEHACCKKGGSGKECCKKKSAEKAKS